ncbi:MULTISPECIES: GGDEF domain-containing protein [unclassified Psychrobacter]|uniref:GGDEF domain-containing protein n=1 Tax=unclassified Psychrobacter TaxID=196806 RepID=UPI0025B479E8|nr:MULTISPECIES: GGDEF domain-containing protein [unclassified Psychrobacter]MDN3452492.1 GGDEF domain-containing protein [Psychrobacter sp. APC 3350]MDN3502368.1 GGDEF domain-containing protein [Psychrobacter sp. 5A.1]
MAVSISHLGYKKLSQMIFEWQAVDRTLLLALFIIMEVSLHWLWCLFVWWRQDALNSYVNMNYLYPLWLGISLVGLFFLCMVKCLYYSKNNNDSVLSKWQIALILVYTAYISTVIVMIGYSSLFAGVSLVGGAMLAMMLIKRRYAWRMFWLHIVLMLLAILSPYFGINLPNLRQLSVIHPMLASHNYLTYNEIMAAENAVAALAFENNVMNWDSISALQRSSALFWRSTHLYLALPKAIFMVYMFRALLLVLDDSKHETMRHANQDELTQLKNRRYGLKKMKYALSTVREYQDLSVMLLDLDWFKQINDNYGHDVGDHVLVEVSQTLLQSLSDETIISRYGGEEFLVVLPDTGHECAMLIAEQLRLSIAKHIFSPNGIPDFNVTASFGLYTLTHAERADIVQGYKTISQKKTLGQTLPLIKPIASQRAESHIGSMQKLPSDICQRLISMADKALYEAKHRGRNQVVSANNMLVEKDCGVLSLYQKR